MKTKFWFELDKTKSQTCNLKFQVYDSKLLHPASLSFWYVHFKEERENIYNSLTFVSLKALLIANKLVKKVCKFVTVNSNVTLIIELNKPTGTWIWQERQNSFYQRLLRELTKERKEAHLNHYDDISNEWKKAQSLEFNSGIVAEHTIWLFRYKHKSCQSTLPKKTSTTKTKEVWSYDAKGIVYQVSWKVKLSRYSILFECLWQKFVKTF